MQILMKWGNRKIYQYLKYIFNKNFNREIAHRKLKDLIMIDHLLVKIKIFNKIHQL